MQPIKILSLATVALLAIPAARAQEKPPAKPTATEASAKPAASIIVISTQKPAYPLTTCVACGKALPETPVEHVKDGRLYRLDAEACKAAVDADSAAMAKKVVAAVVGQQKATYPMKVSVVSGKDLGATAVDHVHGTRLVRLASQDEIAAYQRDMDKAMAKLDKAYIDAQLAGYTLKACPVSKEELGGEMGEPVNYLYGTKLVRFCCKKCIASFEEKPEAYLKETTSAR